MSIRRASFLFVLIALNAHLWVSFIISTGPAIPMASNIVTVAIVLLIFVSYVVFQLWPRPTEDSAQRLSLAIVSLFFIPLLVIAFAHAYREITIAGANIDDDYIYFSVVTFTTLGYGDLTPEGTARIMSILQAISGFLFVPLLISQLINSTKDVTDEIRERAVGIEKAREIVELND